MKKLIIDTNVLISFITDRNLQQQEIARQVFEDTAGLGRTLYCPFHTLTEFVYVLDTVYGVERERIRTMAREFVDLPGVEILYDVSLEKLFEYWPKIIPDYGDAVVASAWAALKKRNVAVFTFDRKFQTILRKLGIPLLVTNR